MYITADTLNTDTIRIDWGDGWIDTIYPNSTVPVWDPQSHNYSSIEHNLWLCLYDLTL